MNNKIIITISISILMTIFCIAWVDEVCAHSVTQPVVEREIEYSMPAIYHIAIADGAFEECIIGEATAPVDVRYVENEEYPIVVQVVNYLVDKDYNKHIIAGILGNFMAETGGQTLKLNPTLMSSDGYYGIAQWSKRFNPSVINKDLDFQLDYLMSNIESAFNTYGKNYAKGFNYEKFLALEDEREAALAFAKCYERCSSASYDKRKNNATKALEILWGIN